MTFFSATRSAHLHDMRVLSPLPRRFARICRRDDADTHSDAGRGGPQLLTVPAGGAAPLTGRDAFGPPDEPAAHRLPAGVQGLWGGVKVVRLRRGARRTGAIVHRRLARSRGLLASTPRARFERSAFPTRVRGRGRRPRRDLHNDRPPGSRGEGGGDFPPLQGYAGEITYYAGRAADIESVYRLPTHKLAVSGALAARLEARGFGRSRRGARHSTRRRFFPGPDSPCGDPPFVLVVGPLEIDFKGAEIALEVCGVAGKGGRFRVRRVCTSRGGRGRTALRPGRRIPRPAPSGRMLMLTRPPTSSSEPPARGGISGCPEWKRSRRGSPASFRTLPDAGDRGRAAVTFAMATLSRGRRAPLRLTTEARGARGPPARRPSSPFRYGEGGERLEMRLSRALAGSQASGDAGALRDRRQPPQRARSAECIRLSGRLREGRARGRGSAGGLWLREEERASRTAGADLIPAARGDRGTRGGSMRDSRGPGDADSCSPMPMSSSRPLDRPLLGAIEEGRVGAAAPLAFRDAEERDPAPPRLASGFFGVAGQKARALAETRRAPLRLLRAGRPSASGRAGARGPTCPGAVLAARRDVVDRVGRSTSVSLRVRGDGMGGSGQERPAGASGTLLLLRVRQLWGVSADGIRRRRRGADVPATVPPREIWASRSITSGTRFVKAGKAAEPVRSIPLRPRREPGSRSLPTRRGFRSRWRL